MAGYRDATNDLRDLDAEIVFMSADACREAAATAKELELDFALLCGLEPEATAERLGTYLNPEPKHLQPAGFVLKPDGTIAEASYSSGPTARMQPTDALAVIQAGRKAG